MYLCPLIISQSLIIFLQSKAAAAVSDSSSTQQSNHQLTGTNLARRVDCKQATPATLLFATKLCGQLFCEFMLITRRYSIRTLTECETATADRLNASLSMPLLVHQTHSTIAVIPKGPKYFILRPLPCTKFILCFICLGNCNEFVLVATLAIILIISSSFYKMKLFTIKTAISPI